MKLYFILACFVYLASCHVTNKTKAPLEPGLNNDAQPSDKEGTKHERVKVPEDLHSHVYLEDVVNALKNQNWTGNDEECLNRTLMLLSGLQNFTLWSVWSLDSLSLQPQGLLFGNQYQFGNFDECLSPPWRDTHPELQTQYCIAGVTLDRKDNGPREQETNDPYQSALGYIQYEALHKRPLNQLTWGICVPAACSPRSVERLLHIMLARSHLGAASMRATIISDEQCQRGNEDESKSDGAFYGFIALMAVLSIAALVGTYLHQKCAKVINGKACQAITKAFCIKENAGRLLNIQEGGCDALYGIRFLTTCLIVLDHQLAISNSGPITNGAEVDRDLMSFVGVIFLHNDLFVDSFFVISGFLMAFVLHKVGNKVKPLVFILKRYSRLAIAFGVVIYYQAAVFPRTGSGPLWPRAVTAEAGPCQRNWWLSLLMLNNYIHSKDICIVVSWYIPCDFHFSVIAILLFWMYMRHRRIIKMLTVIILIASLVIPAVLNYMNNFPAIQLFTYEFMRNPRGLEQFHVTYIKSHTRAAAYLLGFLAGYCYALLRTRHPHYQLNKKWSTSLFVFCLAVMTAVMCSGSLYLVRHEKVEAAVYAALNRPLWAAAIAGMIVCLCTGTVPLVSGFLSWYPFVPLSRLSYGLYLTHTVIIVHNVFSMRSSQYNDHVVQLVSALGVLACGLACALVLWLLAEAPAGNLLSLVLAPGRQSKSADSDTKSTTEPASSRNSADHLPACIQYTSKV